MLRLAPRSLLLRKVMTKLALRQWLPTAALVSPLACQVQQRWKTGKDDAPKKNQGDADWDMADDDFWFLDELGEGTGDTFDFVPEEERELLDADIPKKQSQEGSKKGPAKPSK